MLKNTINLIKVFFVLLVILSILLSPVSNINSVEAQDAKGYPAHYIVFKGKADGSYEAVSYREVQLSSQLLSLDDDLLESRMANSPRHKQMLIVSLETSDGRSVYQGLVDTSPWLRGEWPDEANPQVIDGRMVEMDQVVFTVRVPKIAGTRLVFKEDLQTEIQSFDLTQIVKNVPAEESNQESKLGFAEPYGSPANRVDILVMGDGYTSAQESQFNTHFTTLTNGFYSKQPLTNYRNYTNMVSLFTASQQSGADHPPYMPPDKCPGNDNPSCCTDPLMQNDPLNGQMVNTAFDARYCSWGMHRLLVADLTLVLEEAGARYPDWDTIILLVNDETYGGSASGSVSVISTY